MVARSLNFSVIGFSSPRFNLTRARASSVRRPPSVLDGGCAQGAPGRAGFVRFHRSTNLRTAAAFSFSSDGVVASR